MRNYFEDLDTIKLTAEMDSQLRAQVDVAWPKEVVCLEEHGLKEAKNILDIGTGNAYFLLRLAKRYPEKAFTGVEISEPLIKVAEELIRENKLSNVRLVKDRCPTDQISAGFDLIIARLAIYQMPNREEVISWGYDLLNKGSRMVHNLRPVSSLAPDRNWGFGTWVQISVRHFLTPCLKKRRTLI